MSERRMLSGDEGDAPYYPASSPSLVDLHSTKEEDDIFIETFFDDGPLGVTLRRRVDDGIVFIFEVVKDSQAVNMDVMPGDELWAAADMDIGGTPLDKEAWDGLIKFIKQSPRPLRLVWKRSKHPKLATPPSHSAEYLELEKVLVRLVGNKDKAKDSKRATLPEPASLLREGRRLIKSGDLTVEVKNSSIFVKANNKRRVILLNDLLLITIPQTGNVFSMEYVIDLQTCKVKSLGHVFGLSMQSTGGNDGMEDNYSFELLWPGGDIQLWADSNEAKDAWVMSIYMSICDSLKDKIHYLGWRHQYLIGTMHSAVLSRNEERVRELITLCQAEKMDYKVIESFDDDGYTPLHYACILRLQNIVRLLHDATADVTASDAQGFTPLHWAAMQLDDYSLNLLCSHVFDLDLMDRQNRSPLVLACLEGRDISGVTDPLLLKKCLEVMIGHKPNLHWVDQMNRSLIHYLAASWQNDPLEVLLEHGCPDVNTIDTEYGMTPLHFAARANPIKLAVGEGMRIVNSIPPGDDSETRPEPINVHGAVDTIRTLLQYGAKPNYKDYRGKTVIHLLLAPEVAILWEMEELEATLALLISCGARPDDSLIATMKSKFPELNVAAFQEKWSSLAPIDCKRLDIKLNQYELLPDIRAIDSDAGSTPVSPSPTVSSSQSTSTATANPSVKVTGDNSKPSCTMCGFQFTMFKRQHHCRLCNSVCCDDCSKKRVIIDNNQVRACDCCFNRVLMAQEKFNVQSMIANMKPLSTAVTTSDQSTVQSLASQADNENKNQLFGRARVNSTTNAAEGKTKSSETVFTKSQGRASATMGVLSDTHERLLERGEKLNRLQDRTEDMANQASEFARLAKQLNEQQKARWF